MPKAAAPANFLRVVLVGEILFTIAGRPITAVL
jgi:hypothetical protein